MEYETRLQVRRLADALWALHNSHDPLLEQDTETFARYWLAATKIVKDYPELF